MVDYGHLDTQSVSKVWFLKWKSIRYGNTFVVVVIYVFIFLTLYGYLPSAECLFVADLQRRSHVTSNIQARQ